MLRRRRVARVGRALAALLVVGDLLSACGSDSVSPIINVNTGVSHVALTPAVAAVDVGATTLLAVTLTDDQGAVLQGHPVSFASGNTSVATVDGNGVVTGVSAGQTTISATSEGVSGSATVNVAPPATGDVVVVSPGTTYQTISGWEGVAQIGELDCNQTAYANYKTPVLDALVTQLGINRVRLPLPSGLENTVDIFPILKAGNIPESVRDTYLHSPVNDNSNPLVTDPNGFKWAWLDYKVDEIVNPLRQRLQARGEHLYVTLNYLDSDLKDAQGNVLQRAFVHLQTPAEYAEFIAAAFLHLQQKYGWVPDAVELINEPEYDKDSFHPAVPFDYGSTLANAAIATGQQLGSLSYHPAILGPSNTSMANAIAWYDQMAKVPGVFQYLTGLTYHRYQSPTFVQLQTIVGRSTRDHLPTSMTEWLYGNVDDLMQDLTVANVVSWEQQVLAYCGKTTNPAGKGTYIQINQSNPASPVISITNDSRDFRQVFAYVRSGAVRLGTTSGHPALLVPAAFRNTTGKNVVVVRTLGAASFTVRGLPTGTYGINFNTSAQHAVDLPDVVVATGGTASVSMPAKGVVTLYAR